MRLQNRYKNLQKRKVCALNLKPIGTEAAVVREEDVAQDAQQEHPTHFSDEIPTIYRHLCHRWDADEITVS